jgi:hypothetical protein
MKNAVFWDVTSCGSCKNRRFGGAYRLHLSGKNQRAGNIAEDGILHIPWFLVNVDVVQKYLRIESPSPISIEPTAQRQLSADRTSSSVRYGNDHRHAGWPKYTALTCWGPWCRNDA